jgi:hypothetical protein
VFEKFDDEHLDSLYATWLLDREDSERLTARICSSVNTTMLNALRLSGTKIGDDLYRAEDEYMPTGERVRKPRIATWNEIRANLGF